MKKLLLLVVIPLLSYTAISQVGINNTDPKATLDLTASSVSSPSNIDGILIPRIDDFPSSNPGADQDGMMVFVTGNGTPAKGFYYWDNGGNSWTSVGGGVDTQNTLDGAYDEGGAGLGRTIIADNGAIDIQGSGGLRVEGIITAGEYIIHDGDADTFMQYDTDRLIIDAGGVNYVDIENTASELTINEDSNAIDFRVESDNQANMLFVDGSANSIGIGEPNPISPLQVGIQTTWDLSVSNTGQDGLFLRGTGDNSGLNAKGGSIGFGGATNTRSRQRKAGISALQTGADEDLIGLGFYVHPSVINLSDMVEGMRLTHDGYLGINNTDPSANLDVIGTMQFVDGNESAGYLLSSDANGNASWTDPSAIALDDNDWTEVGADLERQSGNVYIGDTGSTDNDLYISDRVIDWDDTSYFLDPASSSRLGELQIDNGTSAAPSLYFGSDTTTGIAGGVNTIRMVTGGSSNHWFTEKGQLEFSFKQSVLIGLQAGENLTASFNNSVFIGNNAGRDETTGQGNNAIGFSALAGATGSSGNNIMGQYAASSITDGSFNTGVGGSTLRQLTSGDGNTAIGSNAGYSDVDSSNNTYLGYQAGAAPPANSFNRTGNVFLGYTAGYNQNVSNRLFIENSTSTTPLVYGEFDNDIVRVNGTFEVGDPSGTGFALPATDGTAGQILITDGAGQLSFSAAVTDTDWVDNGADIERQSGDVYIGDSFSTDNDLYISDRIIDWDSNTYYLDPATGSRLNEVDFDQGSASDPSITFSDTDSGIFGSNAGRQIDFVNDGTTSVSIASNGHMKLNTTLDYGQLGVVSGDFSNSGISARNTDAGEGLEVVVTGNRSTFGGVMSALTISQQGTSTNTVNKFGIYNAALGSGAGDYKGLRNVIDPTSSYTGRVYGVANDLFYNSTSETYGVYNGLTGTNSGTKYGTYNYFTGGSGSKYGTYTTIGSSEGGTHYGIYADVQSSSGYAGYFLGRMYLGESATDRYYMPAADGTNGQVITTDGAGNLSWSSASGESSTASNGLTESGDDIQLGGTLSQATTIAHGNFGLTYNLTGTGDFAVQDNGSAALFVEDSGEVGVGTNTPIARLDVRESGASVVNAMRLIKSDNTSAITYGLYMEKDSDGTGVSRGVDLNFSGTGSGARYGMDVGFSGSGTAARYAYYSSFSGASIGTKRGINNIFSGSGSGTRMGAFNNFESTVNGAQYGSFNQFDGSNGNYTGTLNNLSGSTNNAVFGTQNNLNGSGTGAKTGTYNAFSGANGNSNIYIGMDNIFSDTGNGDRWGIRNNLDGTGNGVQYGIFNDLTGTGSGIKYGSYNNIDSGAGGTHYGTYNVVDNTNGWAGYFVGKNYVSDAIGINNANPDGRLDIIHNSTGGTSPHIMLTAQNANSGTRITFDNAVETTNNWVLFARADDTAGSGVLNFFSSEISTNVLRLESDGKVGIMRNPTTNALEVEGEASKTTAGAFIANSDRRLKKNIVSISGETALDKIENMRGVTYEWNDDKTGSQRPEGIQYGFIAQELQEVFPEKVSEDNLGFLQTAYGDYDPIFVEAIKALNIKVKNLESENERLKKMLQNFSELEARISNLEGSPEISNNN